MPTTDSISGGTRHRVGRLAATLALLFTALLLLANVVGAHLACGFDTSACVSTSQKTVIYKGHLPFANTPFDVDFSSVRLAGGGLVSGFRTDSAGRYCIVWAPEDGTFVINGSESYGYFSSGHVLHGRPPAGCQSGNKQVPWWRADDLTSSSQYLAVIGLALLTMMVLVVGIFSGRSKPAARVRAVGLALALATPAVFLTVWWQAL